MKALLAYLVLSSNQLGKTIEDVRDKRGEYCSLDPTFEATREDNLIMGAVEAIDEARCSKLLTTFRPYPPLPSPGPRVSSGIADV